MDRALAWKRQVHTTSVSASPFYMRSQLADAFSVAAAAINRIHWLDDTARIWSDASASDASVNSRLGGDRESEWGAETVEGVHRGNRYREVDKFLRRERRRGRRIGFI